MIISDHKELDVWGDFDTDSSVVLFIVDFLVAEFLDGLSGIVISDDFLSWGIGVEEVSCIQELIVLSLDLLIELIVFLEHVKHILGAVILLEKLEEIALVFGFGAEVEECKEVWHISKIILIN